LARAVGDTGVFAASALANREVEIWGRVAALRAAGQLGTVMHAHFRVVNGPPGRYPAWGVAWMLEPAISGGGALRNLGFHGVDAALSVAAGRGLIVRGAAVSYGAYRLPVEEFATALLCVPDGPAITVEAGYSYAADGGDFEWRIAATGAYLKQTRDRFEMRLADGSLEAVQTPAPSYLPLVRETLRRLQAGMPPPASVGDCAAAAQVIDRIYAAATKGDMP
jgi:predicted dehydrogenase